jgi:hypothetical protein
VVNLRKVTIAGLQAGKNKFQDRKIMENQDFFQTQLLIKTCIQQVKYGPKMLNEQKTLPSCGRNRRRFVVKLDFVSSPFSSALPPLQNENLDSLWCILVHCLVFHDIFANFRTFQDNF